MSEFSKKYIVIKNNRDFSFLFKKGDSIVTFAPQTGFLFRVVFGA